MRRAGGLLFLVEKRLKMSGNHLPTVVPAASMFPPVRQGIFILADGFEKVGITFPGRNDLTDPVEMAGKVLEVAINRIADLKAGLNGFNKWFPID